MKIEKSNSTLSMGRLAVLFVPETTSFVLEDVIITGKENDFMMLFQAMRGHPNLEELVWKNVTFEDPAVDANCLIGVVLASCSKLTRFKLDAVDIALSAIKCLNLSDNLIEVSIVNHEFTDDQAREVASTLVANKTLETVEFWGDYVTDKGSKSVGARLSLNKNIQTVKLSHDGKVIMLGHEAEQQTSSAIAA